MEYSVFIQTNHKQFVGALIAKYAKWVCLKLESRESIGVLEDEWNDFDKLTSETRMLHNTRRLT